MGPLLVEEFGWKLRKNNKMLLGMAPRRFGKSIVLAMIMTAGLLVVPKLNIAVLSTGQRISSGMAKYIGEALVMSGNGHRVIKQNDEVIQIQGDTPGDTRQVTCYPDNPEISLFSDTHIHKKCRESVLFFRLFFRVCFCFCVKGGGEVRKRKKIIKKTFFPDDLGVRRKKRCDLLVNATCQ